MKGFLRLSQLFVFLLLAACSGVSTQVADTDELKKSGFYRYAWATKAMTPQEGRAKRLTTLDHYLRVSVDKHLQKKGYQLVADDQADFRVGYRLYRSVSEGQAGGGVSSMDEAWKVNSNSNSTMMDVGPSIIKENHLRINFINRQTKKEIWFVHAKKILAEPLHDKKKATAGLDKLIASLFSSVPAPAR